MSDQNFLKCSCNACGESIEFPAQGAGLKIECPHCGGKTILIDPAAAPVATATTTAVAARDDSAAPPPETPARKSRASLVILGVLVVAALAGGGYWYFTRKPQQPSTASVPGGRAPEPSTAAAAPTGAAERPEPATASESANATAATVSGEAKSLDDLKPSAVTLEKAKSGSLVYAVGSLKNDSPHQRFGVRIELELEDKAGRPAGKASDYTQVIEPHQEWRFRALVLDSKAVRGSVVGIREDN
jgi:hypothetical protein